MSIEKDLQTECSASLFKEGGYGFIYSAKHCVSVGCHPHIYLLPRADNQPSWNICTHAYTHIRTQSHNRGWSHRVEASQESKDPVPSIEPSCWQVGWYQNQVQSQWDHYIDNSDCYFFSYRVGYKTLCKNQAWLVLSNSRHTKECNSLVPRPHPRDPREKSLETVAWISCTTLNVLHNEIPYSWSTESAHSSCNKQSVKGSSPFLPAPDTVNVHGAG